MTTLAEIPALVLEAGAWAGLAVSVSAGCAVIARSRPVRWVARTLVVVPADRWLRSLVSEVVDQQLNARPLTNGWGTDAVHEIAKSVGADIRAPRDHPPHPQE